MSAINRFIKLTSTYMLVQILIMAGGFISFPIFTRILTKKEYGIMSLISITISIVGIFASGGLRHSAQRYYAEYKKKRQLQEFYSTAINSTILFGLAGVGISMLLFNLLIYFHIATPSYRSVFLCASVLIFVRVMFALIGCFYRAGERASIYSVFAILEKYAGMFLAIFFVSILFYGVFGYYLGLLFGEFLVLAGFTWFILKDMGFPKFFVSKKILFKMLAFGFPLIFMGFSGAILAMGDRYIIGYFMTTEDVATYSVPYNLSAYITAILVTGFDYAFMPRLMSEWDRSNPEIGQLLVGKILKIYCLIGLPIIFGVIALGEDIIVLLASQKYSGAVFILPYVITGEVLKGLLTPMTVGLMVSEKTKVLAKLTLFAAIVNILLNVAFVPLLGLKGAALSTLISYAMLLALGVKASSKLLKIKFPWISFLKYFISAVVMFIFLEFVKINILFSVFTGLLLYSVTLMAIDKESRLFLKDRMNFISVSEK
ncbi:MAG: oligosaccharide flippase family protein [Chlorobi bacterium]|nr:oligosaccharide flippase family protein [Chlorobiota bacterium]